MKIHGKDRVEKITVIQVDEKKAEVPGTEVTIECDTVLVSVGLIPENELIEMTGKPSIPGMFVCGNSLKVYDYVDSVTVDSEIAGKLAAEYLRNVKSRSQSAPSAPTGGMSHQRKNS